MFDLAFGLAPVDDADNNPVDHDGVAARPLAEADLRRGPAIMRALGQPSARRSPSRCWRTHVYFEDDPAREGKTGFRIAYKLRSAPRNISAVLPFTIYNSSSSGTVGMPRHWGLSDKKKLHSAVRTAIGKELKTRYEVPQNLPHRLLTALMQLGGWNQKNATSREKDGERKRRKVSTGAHFRRGR